MAVKNVLCYGDSNTWGYDAVKKFRYPADVRWTGVLGSELGPGYHVIEEGLNARTTVWDDPFEEGKNGKETLIPILSSHCPLDLVIIMLGTNDLKNRFGLSACDISLGAGVLVDLAMKSKSGDLWGTPKVLLVSPVHIADNICDSEFAGFFNVDTVVQTSRKLGNYYKGISASYGCDFMDAAAVVAPSPVDAIHLDAQSHGLLGRAVADRVRMILE
jgi:lysophospholipase L1-like esterase